MTDDAHGADGEDFGGPDPGANGRPAVLARAVRGIAVDRGMRRAQAQLAAAARDADDDRRQDRARLAVAEAAAALQGRARGLTPAEVDATLAELDAERPALLEMMKAERERRESEDSIDAIGARDAEPQAAAPAIELRLLRDVAGEVLDQAAIPTLDWGIAGLNRVAPLPVRAMATIYGPTGAGKTSLALTVAAHRARYADAPSPAQGPAVYLQLELTRGQLAARRAAQITPYTWRQILGGVLRRDELEAALTGEHVYVVKIDRRAPFVDQVKRALDTVGSIAPGVPLLVVDYLQRIRGPGRDVRDSMTTIVDDLVDLIESRDVFGLVLSKGSRDGSRRMRDGKTRGEALVDAAAETSAIEAGSAVALAITYDDRDGEDATDARLEIAKARYGVTGAKIGMRFHGASGRWEELAVVPLARADRETSDRVLDAVRAEPDGFTSANAIHKASKGTRAVVLAAVQRELEPGGRLELRGGRICARVIP